MPRPRACAFATFSYFVSSGFDPPAQAILDDLELMEDGEVGGASAKRWALSAAVAFKETPYGGVRTMWICPSSGSSLPNDLSM